MKPITKKIAIAAASFVATGLIFTAMRGTTRDNIVWILISGLVVVPLGTLIVNKYLFPAN